MTPLSLDSLDDLAVFAQVAETRSFAQAGRQTGVTASAIAKRMARLEERLGVRLLHRSTRSVTLTAEGALFLVRCQRVLDEVRGAELDLSQAAGAPRGRLRVSLPMVGSLLLPALAEFMRAHPQIELNLDLSDRMVDIIDEGFDAAIRSGEPESSDLIARPLGSWPMLIVASPRYLQQRGTPQRPSDLVQHTCLHHCFSRTGKLETWPLDWSGETADMHLPVSMISNNLEGRLCFAEQGLGIACLPEFTVRAAIEAGRLQVVLPAFTVRRDVTFRIYWPSRRDVSPKVRALVDFLVLWMDKTLPPASS